MFLELQSISRWYGNQQALCDVTLSLAPGRIGLLGPERRREIDASQDIAWTFAPILRIGQGLGSRSAWRRHGAARAIGYMPEADALLPGLCGADYVALAGELYGMPRRQARRRAHEVLTSLELGDARYRKLEEYSTGMKQRLKLAQALVHDPPVLLLDEPTSGMDPAGREAMLDLLVSLGQDHGKSMLLSTHLLGDIDRVCDRVVILNRGHVLCQGAVQDLCRRRQDRYRLQIQGEPRAFLDELRLEGVQLLGDNGRGEVRLAVPPGWTTRTFFVLADLRGVLVRGLQIDDEDLEELFHRVIEESQAEAS